MDLSFATEQVGVKVGVWRRKGKTLTEGGRQEKPSETPSN